MPLDDPSGAQVHLALAAIDPFPGVLGVAIVAPTLAIAVVLATKLHLFGWLDPWILGATPVASLLLPLAWLVRRSRARSAVLERTPGGLRLVLAGRTVEIPAGTRVELAWNRLIVGEQDLTLVPLRVTEVQGLRAWLLRAGILVERAAPVVDPHRVSAAELRQRS
jgi:hypothetical protein